MATAESVMKYERHAFEAALEGWTGEVRKEIADRLGLQRIAYTLTEKRGKWHELHDLMTGEKITGRQAVERELAAIGTRVIPFDLEKVINSLGLTDVFNEADLIDRREILLKISQGKRSYFDFFKAYHHSKNH